jgi:hypothetical protein
MGLKLSHQGPLHWHHLPSKFHENLPVSSKVTGGEGHIDRQTNDMMSTFIF